MLAESVVPDWYDDALCAEPAYDDLDWFSGPTEPAREVCRRCIVRDECRDFAIAEDIRDGIWGGLDAKERKAHTRARRAVG